MSERDKPSGCDGCLFETSEVSWYPPRSGDRQMPDGKWLCTLCANTPTGSALSYPSQYPHAEVLRTICYVGNAILFELRLARKEPRP